MRCGPSAQAPNGGTSPLRTTPKITLDMGMGIPSPALLRSQTWARKGSMGACAHIDPLPSLSFGSTAASIPQPVNESA
ncbi:hypothetical protein [Bacteroides sp.]|uniref:hypothetical protein n=1 Tax=Bacteroides sp. TaxID=29523 RepID=UPI003A8D3A76